MRVLFFLCLFSILAADIKVLYTAALIDDQFDSRKEEYLHSLDLLEKYSYLPKTYIVDSCAQNSRSFFEERAEHVLYANTNDLTLRNKGVNEAKALLAALAHFSFKEDDLILKLTGRYSMDSDLFLQTIEAHPETDIFVKFDEWGQAFTGCYAIRCKYLKELLQSMDLNDLEKNLICIETKTAEYIRQKNIPVMILNHLDVTAEIYGWGERQRTHW